jgi:hypothetical protein
MITPLASVIHRAVELKSVFPLRMSTDVAWNGVRIRVLHDSAAVADELRTRLEPFFNVSDETAGIQASYRIYCGRARVPEPADRGVDFYLRYSAAMPAYRRSAVAYHTGRDSLVLADGGRLAFAFRDGSNEVTIAAEHEQDLPKAARRLVQDLVRLSAWSVRTAIIEASAVAVCGQGALVIVGGSMAGKTVMLARLLGSGRPDFMANDEVMLNGRLDPTIACGSPVHVMVRPWLADHFPQLRDLALALRRSGDSKISVHYESFARRFGAAMCAQAPLRALAFLDDGSGLRVAGRDESMDRLASSSLWDHRWRTPWRRIGGIDSRESVTREIFEQLADGKAVVLGREACTEAVLELAGS